MDGCARARCWPQPYAHRRMQSYRWVAQYDGRSVQGYSSSGSLIRTIGSALKGASGRQGSFYGPAGLAFFKSNLVIADPDNNRFQVRSDEARLR